MVENEQVFKKWVKLVESGNMDLMSPRKTEKPRLNDEG